MDDDELFILEDLHNVIPGFGVKPPLNNNFNSNQELIAISSQWKDKVNCTDDTDTTVGIKKKRNSEANGSGSHEKKDPTKKPSKYTNIIEKRADRPEKIKRSVSQDSVNNTTYKSESVLSDSHSSLCTKLSSKKTTTKTTTKTTKTSKKQKSTSELVEREITNSPSKVKKKRKPKVEKEGATLTYPEHIAYSLTHLQYLSVGIAALTGATIISSENPDPMDRELSLEQLHKDIKEITKQMSLIHQRLCYNMVENENSDSKRGWAKEDLDNLSKRGWAKDTIVNYTYKDEIDLALQMEHPFESPQTLIDAGSKAGTFKLNSPPTYVKALTPFDKAFSPRSDMSASDLKPVNSTWQKIVGTMNLDRDKRMEEQRKLESDYLQIYKQAQNGPVADLLKIAGGHLYSSDVVDSVWEIRKEEVLGSGASSIVYKANSKLDLSKKAAIKVIQKAHIGEELVAVCKEIFTFRIIELEGGHPNIVRMYGIHEDLKNVYLVMELLTGGMLLNRIVDRGQYTEKHAALAVVDMLSSLQFVHSLSITHRDIKPENFVYQSSDPSSRIMLTDFGISYLREDPDSLMKTTIGTPLYLAPEVLYRQPYGPEVDIWSLGILVYIMLSGYPPFDDSDLKKLVRKIKYNPVRFDGTEWVLISEEGKNFINSLLDKDPSNRLTAAEALQHPWLRNNCNAATKNFLEVAQQNIKSFVNRARWKVAINALQAIQKFKGIVSQYEDELEEEVEEELDLSGALEIIDRENKNPESQTEQQEAEKSNKSEVDGSKDRKSTLETPVAPPRTSEAEHKTHVNGPLKEHTDDVLVNKSKSENKLYTAGAPNVLKKQTGTLEQLKTASVALVEAPLPVKAEVDGPESNPSKDENIRKFSAKHGSSKSLAKLSTGLMAAFRKKK